MLNLTPERYQCDSKTSHYSHSSFRTQNPLSRHSLKEVEALVCGPSDSALKQQPVGRALNGTLCVSISARARLSMDCLKSMLMTSLRAITCYKRHIVLQSKELTNCRGTGFHRWTRSVVLLTWERRHTPTLPLTNTVLKRQRSIWPLRDIHMNRGVRSSIRQTLLTVISDNFQNINRFHGGCFGTIDVLCSWRGPKEHFEQVYNESWFSISYDDPRRERSEWYEATRSTSLTPGQLDSKMPTENNWWALRTQRN